MKTKPELKSNLRDMIYMRKLLNYASQVCEKLFCYRANGLLNTHL